MRIRDPEYPAAIEAAVEILRKRARQGRTITYRELDVFKSNIERKGKNTLGLYISMSNFTSDALAVYSLSTPFITMDGGDFMAVLDQRIRLDELMRRKKRHASETGHCFLPVSKIFSESD